MFRPSAKRAFTLIELLVVVAIIALLISILLPSLQGAREQGKRATCLSNLSSIAKGAAAYSTEDKREHAIPIQQQMASTHLGDNIPGTRNWGLRTALPFAYGGRTAQVMFPTDGGNTLILTKENGRWAARTKPLNRYLYGASGLATQDSKNMPLYRCPSDDGYPDNALIRDAPYAQCAGIPVYDMIGNSFRFNFAGVFFPSGGGSSGEVSIGPYGHRASTLPNPARQMMFMEPMVYSMTFTTVEQNGSIPPFLLLRGWHKAVMTGNVSYADGSARSTKIGGLIPFDAATLREMNYIQGYDWNTFLRRGDSWQMDCYPTPAAYIPKYDDSGNQAVPDSTVAGLGRGWPVTGFQKNFSPP